MYLSYPIVAAYAVFIVLSTLRLDARLSIFIGMVAAIEYVALSVYFLQLTPEEVDLVPRLLSPMNYVTRAIVFFLTGVGAAFVAREIRRRLFRSFEILEERNQIRDVFGQHTAPDVVDALLREGSDMKSQRRHVTIMFLDIRGFTAYSEKRDPEEVVAYLNTLFAFMIDIVNDNRGIIHQLLGDGFMAIFGAPVTHGGNSQQAVDASLAILAQLAEEEAAGNIPPTRIGIGLHAGEVVVGTVGSAIHKEYKVTGDVVNLASRIEQLNKKYESQLLISEAVRSRIVLQGIEAVEKGTVDIRGRAEPVRVYQLA
jgi:adenylate cyclase